MRRTASIAAAVWIVALAACGGNVETQGTGGHAGSTTGGGGHGGAAFNPEGDCSTDADCNGQHCVEVAPGGYKICLHPPPEATTCSPPGGPEPDQCCKSTECQGGGKCYSSQSLPYCGGVGIPMHNQCAGDGCQKDGDCFGPVAQICAPAGAFGSPGKACVNAYCKTDADCTAKPDGRCRPILQGCCAIPEGLACVYAGGCDAACAADGGKHCEIDPASLEGVCLDGPAPCPA